jgi:hypothetical protein
MNVTDSEFFMVRLPGGESVHDEREGALEHLRANADGLDAENDDVSVVAVSVDGADWQIKEMSWQTVALELLNGGEA